MLFALHCQELSSSAARAADDIVQFMSNIRPFDQFPKKDLFQKKNAV